MPIDPLIEAKLAAIQFKATGIETVGMDLVFEAQDINEAVTEVRTALDGGPIVVPPPPTTTPVTIVTVACTRPSAGEVAINYVLAGTMSRVTKLAVSVTPGGWEEFPVPITLVVGHLVATVNVKPGAGSLYLHVWDDLKPPNAKGEKWIIFPASYLAAAVVVPPVEPPVEPPPPGTGTFTFKADAAGVVSLYEDGKLFIPIGVNVPGPNGYWGGGFTPVGKAARLRSSWGWNFIRLFEQRTTGGDAEWTPSAHNPYTIAQVVDEYTAAGYVVMLDWHQYGFGAALTQAKTAEMIAVHTGWANQFKNNPRVWFELCNEPDGDYAVGGMNQAACFSRWYGFQAPVIAAIRATGATNMIVVNDTQSGMGCSDFYKIGPSTGSAIMAKGAQLLAQDPTGNLMWDVHCYDNFGWAGPQGMSAAREGAYTDGQRNARVLDYIDRIHRATGRPVIGGEFGWRVGDSPTVGSGYHPPYDPGGSRTLLGQQAWTRSALARNTGGTQWPGFQLCTNGNDAYDATQLTACGLDWWKFCGAARVKMISGSAADVFNFNGEREADQIALAMPARLTVERSTDA